MKQIIQEVLKAEERVDVALGQARERASETIGSAEREIAEKLGDAKERARQIIQTAVEEAEKEAKRIRAEKLKQTDQQQDTILHDNADVIDDLVGRICRIVLAAEHEVDIR